MENYIWLLVVVGGTLTLGVALAYGSLQKRLTPEQKREQSKKTKEMFQSDASEK